MWFCFSCPSLGRSTSESSGSLGVSPFSWFSGVSKFDPLEFKRLAGDLRTGQGLGLALRRASVCITRPFGCAQPTRQWLPKEARTCTFLGLVLLAHFGGKKRFNRNHGPCLSLMKLKRNYFPKERTTSTGGVGQGELETPMFFSLFGGCWLVF